MSIICIYYTLFLFINDTFFLGSKYLCHDDMCRNGDHFDEPNVWSKKLTNETGIKV